MDNRSKYPFRRQIMRRREEAFVEDRDPLHEVGAIEHIREPGILATPMNVPDLKDVPAPSSMDPPNSKLPPLQVPNQFQAEHRNNRGYLLTDSVFGSRFTPVIPWPTATNAGSDTAIILNHICHHVLIQNNTLVNVNAALNEPATPGTLLLTPGAIIQLDIPFSEVHLYTAAAQNINGFASGNIYVAVYE